MPIPATLAGIAAAMDLILAKEGITPPDTSAVTMADAFALLAKGGPPSPDDGSAYATGIAQTPTGPVLNMARTGAAGIGVQTWTVPIKG